MSPRQRVIKKSKKTRDLVEDKVEEPSSASSTESEEEPDTDKYVLQITIFATFADLLQKIQRHENKYIAKDKKRSVEDLTKYSMHIKTKDESNEITPLTIKLSQLCNTNDITCKTVQVKFSIDTELKEIHIHDITGFIKDLVKTNINTMIIKWKQDLKYLKIQETLCINKDPEEWTTKDVKLWLKLVSLEYDMNGVNYERLQHIDGKKLLNLTKNQLISLVQVYDKYKQLKNNLLWTHLQVLKEYRIVPRIDFSNYQELPDNCFLTHMYMRFNCDKYYKIPSSTNNNSLPSLSRFLYDLLRKGNHADIIKWTGVDYEFKIIEPSIVAVLWFYKNSLFDFTQDDSIAIELLSQNTNKVFKVDNKPHCWKFNDFEKLIGDSIDEKLGTY